MDLYILLLLLLEDIIPTDEPPAKVAPEVYYNVRVCNKDEVSTECRKLTQAEISSGAVRGMHQPSENQQP